MNERRMEARRSSRRRLFITCVKKRRMRVVASSSRRSFTRLRRANECEIPRTYRATMTNFGPPWRAECDIRTGRATTAGCRARGNFARVDLRALCSRMAPTKGADP